MCGFFISNDPIVGSSNSSLIEDSLNFRGPDYNSGLIKHNKWWAFHSRLAIIDLNKEANQPVFGDDGGMLVYNGEILNYKELGNRHFSRDYNSDTLLLIDLISHQKLNVDELDGFFSFVYVDKNGEIKFACRDKFGVKPLYCYERDGYISFSSEPALLKKIFDLEVNPSSIQEYYATRAPIFSGSFFKNIISVEPGTCYVNGKYFDILDYFSDVYDDYKDKYILNAISDGIASRQVSDAPVGLLLSRGVDSHLIKSLSNIKNYYSIGFDGDEDIEYLAGKGIKELTIVRCNHEEYKDNFEYLLKLRGEPLSVPNEVLLYQVARVAAKDGIKVLLSGEGADEFFAGYDRVFNWSFKAEIFSLDEFLNLYCYIPPEKNSDLYLQFKDLFKTVDKLSVFEKVRWFFVKFHMPILFRRLDFSLMAAGVEGREPLANMHTFTKAMKMSPGSLLNGRLGKLPLREIIKGYMGNDFAYEKKVGFPVDLKKVFSNKDNLTSYEIWFEQNLKVLK